MAARHAGKIPQHGADNPEMEPDSPGPAGALRSRGGVHETLVFLMGKDELDFGMGAGDDVHADEFADLLGGGGTGIGGGLDGADVATDHDGHEAAADLDAADEGDVCGLDHGIGGFNGADEALGFDHSESVGGSHVDLLIGVVC